MLTTLQMRSMRARAEAVSDPDLKKTLTNAMDAFMGQTRERDERFPDMSVAGFADWAAIRLWQNAQTRLSVLNGELLLLLDEERDAIEAVLQDDAATADDVLDFVVFYDDEKDGFVRRFNDAVVAHNRAVGAAAARVEAESTELSSGFAHRVWGILSFALLGLVVFQLIGGREWIPMDMGRELAAFLVIWLASELLRIPADHHFTKKLYVSWSRGNLGAPATAPRSTGRETRSDLYSRGAIQALESLNSASARREKEEAGRVSRKTLRRIARDENGPLVDAPALFARQHQLDIISPLGSDLNVEGFFAWARARIQAIVDTEERTLNGEINAMLGEELQMMEVVLARGDSATADDVERFVAWYTGPADGYVGRFNDAVGAYNREIVRAVRAVRLRSATGAAVAAGAGVVAIASLNTQSGFSDTLINVAREVGLTGATTMRGWLTWIVIAALVFVSWKVWSWVRHRSMRWAHVNWNQRHPDHMLVLPDASRRSAAPGGTGRTRRSRGAATCGLPDQGDGEP